MAHEPAEHPSSDSLASAEAHAAAGEVHEHPNWSTYKWVALILTGITMVEVWVYYIPSFVASRLFVPALLTMSAVRLGFVVYVSSAFRSDQKRFHAHFTRPVSIAM